MKKLIMSALVCLLPLTTLAFGLDNKAYDCKWIDSGKHSEGFFQDNVSFDFEILDGKFKLKRDALLNRRYEPCWVGGFSSCYFAFNYEPGQWDVESMTLSELKVSSSWYWTAELSLKFDKPIFGTDEDAYLQNVVISGDDGDGVAMKDHLLQCTVMPL